MNTIKKLLLFLVAASFVAACSTGKKPDTDTMAAKTAVPLPYTANYSSSFEMGNPAYAAMILQGSWKDYEDNKLENIKNWTVDTIMAYHSNNDVTRGADSLIARWKRGRASYTKVQPGIDAVVPLFSTDKQENWVLVWATEIDTKTDGTVDTVSVMETWRINKDGKADLLYQFDRAKRKK
jgi:hypothetical protein